MVGLGAWGDVGGDGFGRITCSTRADHLRIADGVDETVRRCVIETINRNF